MALDRFLAKDHTTSVINSFNASFPTPFFDPLCLRTSSASLDRAAHYSEPAPVVHKPPQALW